MTSPFPSSTGTNTLTLQRALDSAQALASVVKSQVNGWIAQANSGNMQAVQIIGIPGWLNAQNVTFSAYAAVPGLGAYAQAAFASQIPDIVASFAQMQAAITATALWVTTNFPKDSGNFLQAVTYDASGNLVYQTFTAAALAGFIAQLQALLATIN